MQQMFEGSVILGKVNFQLPLDAGPLIGFFRTAGKPQGFTEFPRNLRSLSETPHCSFLTQWDLQSLKCLDSSSSPFTVPFLEISAFLANFGTSQQRRKDGFPKSIPQPSMSQFWEVVLGEETPQEGLYLENMLEPFFSVSDEGNLNLILQASLPPCISIYQRKIWKNSGSILYFWLLQGC